MPQSKRMTNFELLRVLAMLMVVVLHYNLYNDLLPELSKEINARQIFGTMLESFCIVAVNVYVLISGYFMIQSKFRISRVIRLICQVLFYTLLIPLVLLALGIPILVQKEGIYGGLKYLFPISTGHYWFVTQYVILCLLSPFLNAAGSKLDKRQFGIGLGSLLILFCGIKSIFPVSLPFDYAGYDFGWFICLYLTGGYIRLYGIPFLEKGKRGWLIWLGSSCGMLLLTLVTYYVYRSTGQFAYYFNVPFHYNFILCYISSIGLFFGFSKIQIKEGKGADLIRRLGPLCFGVYLLHMHMDLMDRGFQWLRLLFGGLDQMGLLGLFLNMIVTTGFIFCLGIAVDYLRSRIFRLIENVKRKKRYSV